MSDAYIHIRINRNTSIAVLMSLLVHVLALFLLSRQDLFNQHQSVTERPQPISVRLNPRPSQKKPVPASPPASIASSPPVARAHVVHKSKTQPSPVHPTEMPDVIATTKPEPPVSPSPMSKQAPATAKPSTTLDPSQFPDMISYVKAVREQRGLSGEEVTAPAHEPSADEARMANIKRNLQQSGTNGVFQISRMDALTATFSFRGWKNEYSYSRRETYQVEVGANEDIQHAVVRKMIEIIRRYYTGDFNWDSQRLGRVVVLSARLQDNDGLEDFMIREFFGVHGVAAQ